MWRVCAYWQTLPPKGLTSVSPQWHPFYPGENTALLDFFIALIFFFLNSSFSILTPVSTNGYDLDHLLGPGALLNCAISQNVYNRGGIFICVRYL